MNILIKVHKVAISKNSEFYSFILNYAKLKCPYNAKLQRIFKSWNRCKISSYGLFSQNYAYHNKEEIENFF